MATTPTNTTPAPAPKTNRIGLQVLDYRGGKTTLCAGCGHNAISERIIDAMYEMGVQPERVAKFSGIGCSSKSPDYFMNRSHSFNSVHGRMPSVATGAMLANKNLIALGVTGDGDTVSIGAGQFVHLMRRNLPIIYIIEDNGCYGLTKGQFSATADLGSTLKSGVVNDLPPVDTCSMAIQLGATFVGRSFSGDKRQLHTMLKAAIAHNGTAMLDGSRLRLKKLEQEYDPTDKIEAVKRLMESHAKGEVLTGVFYINAKAPSFIDMLNVTDQPLATLPESVTRPSREVLAKCMEELQ